MAPAARPDRSTLSDGELVSLVRNGEADAYAELVRRTQRGGYRLARRITRNHDDADDVLQESYVKAYRALDRFSPDRPFGPWFLTIVARTALSWIRDSKRRAAEPLDEPGRDGAGPLADRVADPAQDPGDVERRIRVERAYARLSEDHRSILALRVEGDLSYAAIAEALSIPVGTVMSRLARARESLVEILNEMREAEPR
jgi:RNA polymerase sigma-70 factor (ECF subfamily)